MIGDENVASHMLVADGMFPPDRDRQLRGATHSVGCVEQGNQTIVKLEGAKHGELTLTPALLSSKHSGLDLNSVFVASNQIDAFAGIGLQPAPQHFASDPFRILAHRRIIGTRAPSAPKLTEDRLIGS